MKEPSPRKFTIADVMILVAAAALSLVLHRYQRESLKNAGFVTWPWPRPWLLEMAPYLLIFPPALLAARALRPRPRARRVFRQPGTVACLACSFQIATHQAFLLALRMRSFSPQYSPFQVTHVLYMGSFVALAWGVQALVGAWRPEPSWIDRAGRGLGIFLIVVWVVLGLHI